MAERFWPKSYMAISGPIDIAINGWTKLAHPTKPDCHYVNSIVISVGSVCRDSGKPWARAATSLYFGAGNPYNESALLGGPDRSTQRAELWSALRALRVVQGLATKWRDATGQPLREVVVQTRSEYVVKSMTERVETWQENAWRNARGLPLANRDLFQRLVNQIRILKGLGAGASLWLVPNERYGVADDMANDILDELEEENAAAWSGGSTAGSVPSGSDSDLSPRSGTLVSL
ncbi:ribonuclease H-like protein [Xylariomycetidae sp. FL2044]|nr:ribonuclease H-like protein [Xylariomycetidae sp. FL2044]